jgi:hypothetical protein
MDQSVEMFRHFKFVISMDNTNMDGAISEKIINAALANSLPIFWGDSRADTRLNTGGLVWCNFSYTSAMEEPFWRSAMQETRVSTFVRAWQLSRRSSSMKEALSLGKERHGGEQQTQHELQEEPGDQYEMYDELNRRFNITARRVEYLKAVLRPLVAPCLNRVIELDQDDAKYRRVLEEGILRENKIEDGPFDLEALGRRIRLMMEATSVSATTTPPVVTALAATKQGRRASRRLAGNEFSSVFGRRQTILQHLSTGFEARKQARKRRRAKKAGERAPVSIDRGDRGESRGMHRDRGESRGIHRDRGESRDMHRKREPAAGLSMEQRGQDGNADELARGGRMKLPPKCTVLGPSGWSSFSGGQSRRDTTKLDEIEARCSGVSRDGESRSDSDEHHCRIDLRKKEGLQPVGPFGACCEVRSVKQ